MIKTFYVQTDLQGKVTDITDYPCSDYKEMPLSTPLPPNVISGAYQLVNGELIYRKEWDIDLVKLQEENKNFNDLILEMSMEVYK